MWAPLIRCMAPFQETSNKCPAHADNVATHSVRGEVEIKKKTQSSVTKVGTGVPSLSLNGYVPKAALSTHTFSIMFSISCCSIHTPTDPCVVSSGTGQLKWNLGTTVADTWPLLFLLLSLICLNKCQVLRFRDAPWISMTPWPHRADLILYWGGWWHFLFFTTLHTLLSYFGEYSTFYFLSTVFFFLWLTRPSPCV